MQHGKSFISASKCKPYICNISGGNFAALLHICQYMHSHNDPGGNPIFKETGPPPAQFYLERNIYTL